MQKWAFVFIFIFLISRQNSVILSSALWIAMYSSEQFAVMLAFSQLPGILTKWWAWKSIRSLEISYLFTLQSVEAAGSATYGVKLTRNETSFRREKTQAIPLNIRSGDSHPPIDLVKSSEATKSRFVEEDPITS